MTNSQLDYDWIVDKLIRIKGRKQISVFSGRYDWTLSFDLLTVQTEQVVLPVARYIFVFDTKFSSWKKQKRAKSILDHPKYYFKSKSGGKKCKCHINNLGACDSSTEKKLVELIKISMFSRLTHFYTKGPLKKKVWNVPLHS